MKDAKFVLLVTKNKETNLLHFTDMDSNLRYKVDYFLEHRYDIELYQLELKGLSYLLSPVYIYHHDAC